ARHYGFHTDASHRFERGVDPELAEKALTRLTALLLKYCGGAPGPTIHAQSVDNLPGIKLVELHHKNVNKLLGSNIEPANVTEILLNLGFELKDQKGGWKVTVPSYRFDIEQEVDLIEEIARVYGYQKISETLPTISVDLKKRHQRTQQHSLIVNRLASIGYYEAITYSFVDADFQKLLGHEDESLMLMNPISTDMSVMRHSLLPGLLMALQFNVKRQQTRLKLFESGRCFAMSQGQINETDRLSGLSYGNVYEKQWGMKDISSDYYSIKSDLEAVLCQFLDPDELIFKNAAIKALHPHQNAEIFYNNQNIGYIGTINPRIQEHLDMPETTQVFEIDISKIPAKTPIKYTKISKFPSIRRDISVIVDENLPAIEVIKAVIETGSKLLDNLELFDVYQGEGIDLGKKSLALGLTFRGSSSTLTDEEADIVTNDVISSLHDQFGAILRE
ncbi:MAG: phenylalanine--tRNA ligase subunit beta, partial [Gammaproteobacteria bacterium]|nr:phenylalanine--tRNA ligase subunit beta [Gammaproteobacteria bacterium]